MRATKDTWGTYEDFEAEWLCSADGGQRDRVAFTLPLEEDFAIGFSVHVHGQQQQMYSQPPHMHIV